jgi:hypothetical protein
VSLEFSKVIDQVAKLGGMAHILLDQYAGSRLEIALDRFHKAPDLGFIHQRIELARSPEVSGYRGAAPLDPSTDEPLNHVVECPPLPARATLIAADGSQIYPSEQSAIHYFLVNVGLFIYHHGLDRAPETVTMPRLFYHRDHVHDKAGRIINNRTVDAMRTVREMEQLADRAQLLAPEINGAGPLVGLYDNHLLMSIPPDVRDHKKLERRYFDALRSLRECGALLGGYVDNPTRSRMVLRLLHLLHLSEEEVRSSDLGYTRELESLNDAQLFAAVLEPGQRSALMAQNSPRNLAYRKRGRDFEIAFFYVKVSSGYQETVARVDLPMWVAADKARVDALHALIVQQATMQGRNPYPYALTRADELAVVSTRDKARLDELIAVELRRQGIDPRVFSAKLQGKRLARGDKRVHEL